jgi:SAM-dependent methyltransferase
MSFRMNSPEGKSILALVRGGDYAHPGEERAVARVAASLPRESIHRILDVGCGRGGTAAWFHQHGWGTIVGLDVDAVSVDYARTHYPQVEFVHLDVAKADSLNGDPFDLAYLFNSFYAFPDQASALSHIRKACREGARLVIFDYTRPSGGELPTELGSEIGRPIVLEDLCAWLPESKWKLISVDDWTDSFVAWYAELLGRFDKNRAKIVGTVGGDWYEYAAGWYSAVHGALVSGTLGGKVVHAVAVL